MTTHELKETLTVDVEVPDHAPRTTTALFRTTKEVGMKEVRTPLAILRDTPGHCYICNATEEELKQPLEEHHFGVERCFAEGEIDWSKVKHDFPAWLGWGSFDPENPYDFVDDMTAQGLTLCKKHHTGKDAGIHMLPFSIWIMQRYLQEGAQFSPTEVIHDHV